MMVLRKQMNDRRRRPRKRIPNKGREIRNGRPSPPTLRERIVSLAFLRHRIQTK